MVALIVTIVVLLILVSITISTVVGDNGIITQAQQKEKELNQIQLNTELTRNELATELEENKTGKGDGIVGFHPDGGNYVLPTGSNVAKVISEIQLANINSGFDIIEYAWSSSDTLAPTDSSTWTKAELVANTQTITNTQAAQGNNYLWVKITDAAEGTSKTFVSSNFNVMNQDDVANKITVTPNKTGWTKDDVNITVSYGDNLPDNRKVGIGSANTDVEGNSTTITMTSNGTIYAEATDIAGNKVTISLEVSNIDKTGPTVSLTRNSATTNSIKVTATATDAGSGVDTYTFYYKKTSESTYKQAQTGTSNTCTFTGLTQTTNYDIKVVVTDKVGNSTEKTLTSQATTTMPVATGNITFSSTPTGYTSGNVTTTITTSRSYTIQYQVGSTTGTWSIYSSGLVSTTNTTIYARLWDGTNAGSYASLTISNIDKTAPTVPTITYNGGANTCSWKNNYNITLSSTDGQSGIAYYESDWNNDGIEDLVTGSNLIPTSGWTSCTVKFRAVDNVGNKSAWTVNQHIHMDTTAPSVPTVTYNGGANTCSWKNNYNITLSATDANSGVSYYEVDWNLDGIVDETKGSSFIPGNGYNSCNVRFRAVDVAGNRSAWTGSNHIHMDTEPPTTPTIEVGYDLRGFTYTYSGYSANPLNDKTVSTTSGDPIIVATGTSTIKNVTSVRVYLKQLGSVLTKDIYLQVFYNTGTGFSEANSKKAYVSQAQISTDDDVVVADIVIPTGTYQSIRVDIGTESGLEYYIRGLELIASPNQAHNFVTRLIPHSTDSVSGVRYEVYNSKVGSWTSMKDSRWDWIEGADDTYLKYRAIDSAGNISGETANYHVVNSK